MPLINLKKKYSEMQSEVASPSAPEDYYPVSMHLGSDEVKKLGLADADVGDEFVMVARVKVSSVSMSKYGEGSESYHNVGLDIVSAEINAPKSSESELASKIFGD